VQDQLYVETSSGRVVAELVADRQRSRILRLRDGNFANIIKDSAQVRDDPYSRAAPAFWLERQRRSWEHLSRQTHPGLLRVGERVTDTYGDEGYVCEGLRVFELYDSHHPARVHLRKFLQCASRLARATGVMHRLGFVHADITPANVCWDAEGFPVLIDYEMTVPSGNLMTIYDRKAARWNICATPDCCSPEQVLGETATPATDVYCLGLTLLSWVSERFGVGGTFYGQLPRHSLGMCSRAEYPHWGLVRQRLPVSGVLAVLHQCIQLVPLDRLADGDEVADRLDHLLESLPEEHLSASFPAIPIGTSGHEPENPTYSNVHL